VAYVGDMVRSITLQNFKSFGERQTVPLEPITVLVGPNNSGKSSFMSMGRFVANSVLGEPNDGVEQEGGLRFVLHRPPQGDGRLVLAWESDEGSYSTEMLPKHGVLTPLGESTIGRQVDQLLQLARPLANSRLIKLSLAGIRADSEVIPSPVLGTDGSGMPSVLGLWQGTTPEKREQLEDFLRRCLPEVRSVLVRPAPTPGYQRLWVRQADGEDFDAEHLSDGLLCFIAIAMHAIEAGPGQLLFIEEPEQYIHPIRLLELTDLLREMSTSKGSQFVLTTYSPVLLNAFRDEPESIVLFRRSETGTRVKNLEKILELKDALPPGDLLAQGFFNHQSF
jgi:predicted ATPase